MNRHLTSAVSFAAILLSLPISVVAQESKAIDAPRNVEPVLPNVDRPRSAVDIAEAERSREPREERDRIETDRDSFTPSVRTVGRNRFVLESAYSFIDERHMAETHSYPETVMRYGLTRRVELRLGWNLEVGGAGDSTSGSGGFNLEQEGKSRIEQETVLQYGIKVLLADQDGWLPESSVILMGRTPTSGLETATHFVGTWVAGWNIGSRLKLDAAIRYATASENHDRYGIWAPSAVLKYEFVDRWSVHLEYFALASTGRGEEYDRHYLSPGVHYLVTDNLEVGVRVGWGLNDQSSRFFANAGFGWRF